VPAHRSGRNALAPPSAFGLVGPSWHGIRHARGIPDGYDGQQAVVIGPESTDPAATVEGGLEGVGPKADIGVSYRTDAVAESQLAVALSKPYP
jgi:hypothetical protein